MIEIHTVSTGKCSLCGYVASVEKFMQKGNLKKGEGNYLGCPACGDGKREPYTSTYFDDLERFTIGRKTV